MAVVTSPQPSPHLTSPDNQSLYLPVVTMHGINDDHKSCFGLISTIKSSMPGVHVVNLVMGETRQKERDHSIYMGMEEQVEWACRLVRADPMLAGGYTGIGYSQGGLLLRGLAQLCPEPPMLQLVTIGSPHQGIAGLPRCPGSATFLCSWMRRVLSAGAYLPWVQGMLAPAQYWHDPFNPASYVSKARFLPLVNNARSVKSASVKKGIARLKLFVMIMWRNDTMIKPKESSHFQFYRPGQAIDIEPLEESTLYQDDWLGLRKLQEDGLIHRLVMEGDHMNFQPHWFKEQVIDKFLKKF